MISLPEVVEGLLHSVRISRKETQGLASPNYERRCSKHCRGDEYFPCSTTDASASTTLCRFASAHEVSLKFYHRNFEMVGNRSLYADGRGVYQRARWGRVYDDSEEWRTECCGTSRLHESPGLCTRCQNRYHVSSSRRDGRVAAVQLQISLAKWALQLTRNVFYCPFVASTRRFTCGCIISVSLLASTGLGIHHSFHIYAHFVHFRSPLAVRPFANFQHHIKVLLLSCHPTSLPSNCLHLRWHWPFHLAVRRIP